MKIIVTTALCRRAWANTSTAFCAPKRFGGGASEAAIEASR